MPGKDNNRLKTRIVFVQALMVLAICLLGFKSFEVQVLRAGHLTEKAENDYAKHVSVKGERGQILDRRHYKLATSIDAVSITACPAIIKNPAATAQKLSQILKINRHKLKKQLSTQHRFTWVKRKVPLKQAEQAKQLNLTGIYFENDSKRYYPNKYLAAQVIGFTGREDRGLEGLEFKYNTYLEGRTLKRKLTKDGIGRVLNLDKKQKAQLKGSSIVLTLDKRIQYLSEQTLEQTVKIHKAKSGMALVMAPGTGELLSIAHYPRFNPNNFSSYDRFNFRNRAVTDSFEPGSAMKVFTAAAALERGLAPKSIFFCENGSYRMGRKTIHDTHEHGWLSINQIIKYSSNIGVAKIAETIGSRPLYNFLVDFGFGSKTRIASPGETAGQLIPLAKWTQIDSGAISFGQGISVSAIQLLTGISAIANNGKLMKPILVKQILSGSGEVLKTYQPQVIRQVITPKTARQIRHMMHLAVKEEGTGTKAAINGYQVCGKTGTAQKALKHKKGYAKNKYTSVFGGFAPKDNPVLATLVIIDEPRKGYYGGDVAAPAFKNIMAEAFNYLNIPPRHTDPVPPEKPAMVAALTDGEKN